MKKIATAALVAAFFMLTACESTEYSGGSDTSPSDPGGIGMTYNGKLGYDMGGGLVMPLDGSAPGLGYGF